MADGKIEEAIDDVPLYSRKRVMVPVILIAAAAMIGVMYWYFSIANTVYTDDAYVDGNRVIISSKYSGKIAHTFA